MGRGRGGRVKGEGEGEVEGQDCNTHCWGALFLGSMKGWRRRCERGEQGLFGAGSLKGRMNIGCGLEAGEKLPSL